SMISRAEKRQRTEGLGDSANVMLQVWTAVISLFDQISEIIGDVRFEFETFVDLLKEGLKATEIGILPSSRDDMMLGTMQRTRSADVRAVIIIGANEGVLPQAAPEGDILAADEIEFLADCGYDLGRIDRVRVMEERLAIYRNLSKPSDILRISWSSAGTDGKEIRASELVDDIRERFPDLEPENDIFSGPADMLIGSPESTMRHLTGELSHASVKRAKLDPVWMAARDWYRGTGNHNSDPDKAARGAGYMSLLGFDNKTEALPPYLASLMLGGKDHDSLSPSRLERYAGCPYRYFIEQGLRPTERRPYEAASREIGDVYHNCIMAITSRLTREGLWETVTDEQCREIVNETVAKENEAYREGLFSYGGKERYLAARMEDTCYETVRALISQARAGSISYSYYELPFGRPYSGEETEPEFRLKPMEIDASGRKIYIEGRIDRLDILENGRLKIIDYKSGNRKIDLDEMRAGYSMQLMVYMQAAENGLADAEGSGGASGEGQGTVAHGPGGMFYFHIKEPRVTSTVLSDDVDETIDAEIRKQFKLNGILVDDPETIRNITGDFTGRSDVAESVLLKTDGTYSGKAVIPEADMRALESEVRNKIGELCEGVMKGEIPIHPIRHKDKQACKYCDIRSICRFDAMYPGCEFNRI
ncbi:MAG: PD-(D/E)XK nuclease family protein, partial [Eubacterium sp.]|nr:PD-(D/E)XK nuclease family protein [Eubacterium sp.]